VKIEYNDTQFYRGEIIHPKILRIQIQHSRIVSKNSPLKTLSIFFKIS